MKWTFSVLGLALLVFLWQTQTDAPLQIIAHRGGALEARENTLAALEWSVACGADMAEFDLRLTADHRVVALHDPVLRDGRRVCDLCSEEITGELPFLSALLDGARGRITLVLDLKENSFSLLDRTVAMIRDFEMEGQCILGASDPALLERSKAQAPEIRTLYIGRELPKDLGCADGYSICLSGLRAHDVERAHETGKRVYSWTVNAPLSFFRAQLLGVDGIVTDLPSSLSVDQHMKRPGH